MTSRLSFVFFCIMILALVPSCFAEDYENASIIERIRTADHIAWAGGQYVLLDNNELINAENGELVLSDIGIIYEWNQVYIAIGKNGSWYRIAENETVSSIDLGMVHLDDFPYYTNCEMGLIVFEDYDFNMYVYSFDLNKIIISDKSHYCGFYQDSNSGIRYFISSSGVYLEDGTPWISEGYSFFCRNANCEFVTNGYITGYRDDGKAVVLSLSSGKETIAIDGYWQAYDGGCEIYLDNTALIKKERDADLTMIIGLDGSILVDLGNNGSIDERSSNYPYRFLNHRWNPSTDEMWYYYWDAETGQTFYQSLKTGKITNEPFSDFLGDHDRLTKYPPMIDDFYISNPYPKKMAIYSKNGSLLSGRYWDGYQPSPWIQDISFHPLFYNTEFLIVYDQETGWGVINKSGDIVVPPIYDDNCDKYSEKFSSIKIIEGKGFIAQKNGEWYILDEEGNLKY